MSRYCNNRECPEYKKPVDDSVNFCGTCRSKTVEDVEEPGSLVGGTANAVHTINSNSNNTSYNTSDSHNTSIGSISSGNVTNNTTIIVDSATAGKLSREEKTRQYKSFCEATISNGIITGALRQKLDSKAEELGLDIESRKTVEAAIREKTSRSGYELSDLDRCTLANTGEFIKANAETNDLMNCISKLKPLAAKSDDDDVHFYLNLLLAVTNPSLLIRSYLERTTDSYWQTFWTYVAHIKNGQREKAETVRTELSAWEEYSQDNIKILYSFGELFSSQTSQIVINSVKNTIKGCSYHSTQLEGLCDAIRFIISLGSGNRRLSGNPSIDFYLGKLWGIRPQQARPASYGSYEANDAVRKGAAGISDNIGRAAVRTAGGGIGQPSAAQAPKPAPKPAPAPAPSPTVYPTASPARKNRTPLYIGVGVAAFALAFLLLRSPETEAVRETKTHKVTKVEQNAEQKTAAKPASTAKTAQSTSSKASSSQGTSSSKTASTTSSAAKPSTTASTTQTTRQEAPKQTAAKPAATTTATSKPAAPKSAADMTAGEALSAGQGYLRNGDFNNAAKYFKSAADRGSAEAQYEIALLYKSGAGVAQSTANAFSYMKAAAEAGFTKAYRELGEMYHGGRGTAKDRSQAEYWYKKAVDAGDQKALRILNNM